MYFHFHTNLLSNIIRIKNVKPGSSASKTPVTLSRKVSWHPAIYICPEISEKKKHF